MRKTVKKTVKNTNTFFMLNFYKKSLYIIASFIFLQSTAIFYLIYDLNQTKKLIVTYESLLENMSDTYISLLKLIKDKDFISQTVEDSVNRSIAQAMIQTNQTSSWFTFLYDNCFYLLGSGILILASIYGYNYVMSPYTTTIYPNTHIPSNVASLINSYGHATNAKIDSIFYQLDLINSEAATLRETNRLTKLLVDQLIDSNLANNIATEIAKNPGIIDSINSIGSV